MGSGLLVLGSVAPHTDSRVAAVWLRRTDRAPLLWRAPFLAIERRCSAPALGCWASLCATAGRDYAVLTLAELDYLSGVLCTCPKRCRTAA